MSGSVNKVTLVGNLGRDPEVRAMQNGDKIVQLSVATSDRWKDKNTGEQILKVNFKLENGQTNNQAKKNIQQKLFCKDIEVSLLY